MNIIRVVIYRSAKSGGWLAQGCERDICVQAPTLKELYERFRVTVEMETAAGNLTLISPAPAEFSKMWDECAGIAGPVDKFDNNLLYRMAG